jgi:oxygen-independent coproporphyrinogen-3 oxidase
MLDEFFGIEGITHCIDVIIGIPGQEENSLKKELDDLCGYRPEHISAYVLSVENGTPLYGRMNLTPEAEDSQKKLFDAARETLKRLGYNHYEISNFSLPGFESRHNMKYWKFMPYAGFGPGAHSFYSGERYINRMSASEYISEKRTLLERDIRSAGARMAEYIMTGMRLLEGISLKSFEESMRDKMPGAVYEGFIRMEACGLIVISKCNGDEVFSLTDKGVCQMDAVIYEIVEPIL